MAEKISRKTRKLREKNRTALLEELLCAKRELDDAARNMNFVKDDMLLEHFIFRIKSCEMKYRYLLSLVRSINDNSVFEENVR